MNWKAELQGKKGSGLHEGRLVTPPWLWTVWVSSHATSSCPPRHTNDGFALHSRLTYKTCTHSCSCIQRGDIFNKLFTLIPVLGRRGSETFPRKDCCQGASGFLFLSYSLVFVYVCGYSKTIIRSRFSPSTTWVPGVELGQSGLAVGVFTSWVISQDLENVFKPMITDK